MDRESFGHYELLERIDVGGMAEVFKAVQRGIAGFERPVAIKRILPSIAADPEIVQMFVQEAKLAVQLSHPGIAQVFDLGHEGEDETEGWFIAMEFVDGRSLLALWERLTARGERIPFGIVAYIVLRVADALDYAHFAHDARGRPLGIIHRDVSPGNVLISFAGEVKVIDFGLAKAANRVSQTRDGIVKGKLAYLSPEQAQGRPIDHRSDLFSLGVCAWELLTGRRAFKRDDDRETVLAIRRGVLEPPSHHASVPPALEHIVMRALAPNVDDRYGTGRALRDDLAAFMARSNLRVGPREVAALMHETFAVSHADASEPIELVREKRRFPHDEPSDEHEPTNPFIRMSEPPPPSSDEGQGETVPNVALPERRRR